MLDWKSCLPIWDSLHILHLEIDDEGLPYKKNIEAIKTIPRLVIKTRNELVILSVNCDHFRVAAEEWKNVQKLIKNIIYQDSPKDIEISIGCGGPVIWN